MSRFELRAQTRFSPPHRPYADWFADVERRMMRRTGECLSANEAPESYWLGLYYCGETAWNAADEYLADRRGGKQHA